MMPRFILIGLAPLLAAGGLAQAQLVAYGDFDGDGDVDLDDHAEFTGCLVGPEGGLGPACAAFDFDIDQDVDISDHAAFQRVFDTSAPPSMVLIPGGEFDMGCHVESCNPDELPVHTVLVSSFYIDVYEVTNRHYVEYLNSAYGQGLIEVVGGVVYNTEGSEPYCDTDSADFDSRIQWDGATFSITAGRENHPMVELSWYGAAAYCNWRSALHGRASCYDPSTWECDFSATGYRLPTEAEWEYAARGGEHDPYYRYPWGDDIDGSQANYHASGDPFESDPPPRTTPAGYYDGSQTPPGSDTANGFDLYDVAGNVWEWCNDWYESDYYGSSPYDNPQGPAGGTVRVLRGGSWPYHQSYLRSAFRTSTSPEITYSYNGFRVAAAEGEAGRRR